MEANQPLLPVPDLAIHLFTGFSGNIPLLLSEAIDGITFFQSFLLTPGRKISVHPQVF